MYITNEKAARWATLSPALYYYTYICETYLCKITVRRRRLALRKFLIQEYEFLTLETASPFRHVRSLSASDDVITRCQ